MNDNSHSIGIFDSGIGGLTVANAISKLLPNENLIYYGDTEHMPYGEKSSDLIKQFSIKISNYLIEHKKCKAIVIACNTASAAAYEELKNLYTGKIPIINVIDPMIEFIIENDYHKVGIIATRGTIDSGIYQSKLDRRKPTQLYTAIATPLLASMIEEKLLNNDVSHSILTNYLSHSDLSDIDALVLACTHYPLISSEIDSYFDHKVTLLNSANVVAIKLKTILQKEHLLTPKKTKGKHQFLVSDITPNFVESTKLFYGEQLNLEEIKLF